MGCCSFGFRLLCVWLGVLVAGCSDPPVPPQSDYLPGYAPGQGPPSGGGGLQGNGTGGQGGQNPLAMGGGGAQDPAVMPVTGPGTIITDPNDDAAYIYDQSQIRTYEVTISQSDLAFLDADPAREQWVAASMTLQGENVSYPVGMRYKGSYGAFVAPCTQGNGFGPGGPKAGKCSVKLSFSWNNPGGRFYGLKRLNFHSMNSDDSLMRDRLGYTMFRQFGMAAPRAVHARLLINGQLEGVFILVEQIDGRFTRSRFTEGGKGNLYKEIWPYHNDAQAYIDSLKSNQDENPVATKILAFKDAINSGTAAMEAWLDRQMTINYIAADRVMIHDDGPFHWWCSSAGQGANPGSNGNHNYYWYEATNADRLWLIPWDMDNSFNDNDFVHIDPEWTATGSCTCSSGSLGSQRASKCDTMINRWGTDWQPDYERAVDAFIAGPYASGNVNALLDRWQSQISAAVQETSGLNSAVSYNGWQQGLSSLKSIISGSRSNRGYRY